MTLLIVTAANMCFAVTNLVVGGVANVAGLLAYRGTGTAGLSATLRPRLGRREIVCGVVHVTHQILFVTALRAASVFLAPAVLSVAAAGLWLTSGKGFRALAADRVTGAAVTAVAVSGAALAWRPGELRLTFLGVVLSVGAAVFYAYRLRLVERWRADLDADGALVAAGAAQAAVGAAWVVLSDAGWVVPAVAVAASVVGSWAGHRLVYAAGRRATAVAVAAGQPLSAAFTLVGGAALLGQTFGAWQAAAAAAGLVSAAVLASRREHVLDDGRQPERDV